jgi:ribosomal-protein-alanine N-acetyltransferase
MKPDRLRMLYSFRLKYLPASEEALRADLINRDALAQALGVSVAEDWPPRYWDPPAVNWLLEKLTMYPSEPFWRAWFVMSSSPDTLIGTCGFKGPPDDDGFVEIGYGIVDSHHMRRMGSEAAARLIAWAWEDPRVRGVCAHTLVDDPASSGVLRRCGFKRVATLDDPTDGRLDRYELRIR